MARQGFEAENNTDKHGHPAGGFVRGTGFSIDWQDGPLGRGEDRQEPNGAFVEDVIHAAIQRIQHYQDDTHFRCRENAIALTHLETAALWLDRRTRDREDRGVEGTHEQ
jgi:hypothetical protein